MNRTPQPDDPPLAAPLRACAAGFYPAEAAAELLIAHASWLCRDFTNQPLRCTRRPPAPLPESSRTILPTTPSTFAMCARSRGKRTCGAKTIANLSSLCL